MQKIKNSICAVVPVYNAQKTLPDLAEGLTAVLGQFEEYGIILVDDCSTDQSFEVIRDLACRNKNITGISLARNCGQQCALFCGLHYARCDYTVIIDDDLENDPKDIMALYKEIIKGYDAVYAVNRAGYEKGLFRSIGSKLRDGLFDRITHKPKDLKVCSFRILNKMTVQKILEANTRFVYISLEILRHTKNIQNIAAAYNSSNHSKYKPAKLIRLLLNMYIYYAPHTVLKKLRRQGCCYAVKEILEG